MKALALVLGLFLGLPILALGEVGGGEIDLAEDHLVGSVLSHPGIHLSSAATSDIRSGITDPRVLGLLLVLAEEHTLDWVGPIKTGHSYYVKGTRRVSNHSFGRAVDIIWVDEAPVSRRNLGALQATRTMLTLPEPLRPDQVGSPCMIPTPGVVVFTKDHHHHLHAGWSE